MSPDTRMFVVGNFAVEGPMKPKLGLRHFYRDAGRGRGRSEKLTLLCSEKLIHRSRTRL